MKKALSMLLGLAVVLALTLTVAAEEKKETTITGTITCAKCDLKVDGQTKCATVIKGKAKGSDKEEVYYFDDESGKKNHGKICKEPMKGSVTGTISEKDGKKIVTVKEVKFD
jgi:hypothetical protein